MVENKKKCGINKRLLAIKGHFFLFNAGTAPMVPFLSLYGKQLGFSSFIVGIIYTVLPITGMLMKPLAGFLADKFFCQKQIFLISILVVAGGFLSIYFSPALPVEHITNSICQNKIKFNNCTNYTLLENLNFQSQSSHSTNQLECQLANSDWNQICSIWTDFKYCSNIYQNNTQALTANIKLLDIHKLSKCSSFVVDNVTLNNEMLTETFCPETIISSCYVHLNEKELQQISKKKLDDNSIFKTSQFWIFLVLMTITWDAMAIVVSVGDTICFALLGDQPSKYGAQRCWGALGWGLLAIISGYVVDQVSSSIENKNYLPTFIIGVILLLCHFVCCCFIKYSQQVYETNVFKGVRRLFTNIRVFIFMIWCTYIGMCTGLMWNFYLWLVEERAKEVPNYEEWISTLQGLLLAVQTLIGELPFFWLSGWFLKRIGHVHAMNLILLVFGIRLILYSVISNPWFYIPIDVCNGFTFGIFYAAMTSYASKIAPPGAATTVQGIVGALFEGVGVSLGSLIGGTLFERIGGPLTFQYFGIFSLAMCGLHVVVQYIINKRRDIEC